MKIISFIKSQIAEIEKKRIKLTTQKTYTAQKQLAEINKQLVELLKKLDAVSKI